MSGATKEGADNKERVFVTTRWSLVISARRMDFDQQKAQAALSELCRTYWRPIFSFISKRGYSMEDAQDLTQDSLVMVIEENWLKHADASHGRVQSFLLKSLQNFLDQWGRRTGARKT